MRPLYTVSVVLVLLFCAPLVVFPQTAGDYRSAATGNWLSGSTWEMYNGSSWIPTGTPPTGSGVITIQSADSIYVDVAVSITGTLRNQGKLGGTGNITIADGGTYEHAEPNGSIPVCTWADGSTCLVTGYTTGSKPSNGNQNFYNFVWNCTAQAQNIDLGMSGNTIRGNFTVISSGATSRVYLTSPASYTYGMAITINGDVIVQGGQFASNGSSSPDTIEVITHGDIIVTAGNFSLSRGSAPDVTWRLGGDFLVSNATLQNSGGFHVNKLIFEGSATHTLDLTTVVYGSGTSSFTMEVQAGSTLDVGTTVIGSTNEGSFILRPGATLATANAGGVAASIQCTGTNGGGNLFSTDANYTFNGSVAQVTSTAMPDTVSSLTINNAAGVTLTNPTVINGTLRLMAGVLDNTVGFTLGPIGTISYEGGSLLIPVAVDAQGGGVPASYALGQNFPNPFNPATVVSYDIPAGGFVSLRIYDIMGKEVAALVGREMEAGTHRVSWDASGMPSGIYYYRLLVTPRSQPGFSDVKTMVLVK